MTLVNLGNLGRRVAVAFPNLPQILARHTIQPINAFAMVPRGNQQFVKRSPIVSPIQVETDALAEQLRGQGIEVVYAPARSRRCRRPNGSPRRWE